LLHAAERARLVVVLAFALLFAAVMLSEYLVFRRALEALAALQHAGPPLTLYLLESFLVLTLIILLVSFVAAGLWIFYQAGDTRLLLAAPLPLAGLYLLRAIQTFAQAGWALAVLGVPALAALGAAYGKPAVFYARGAVILVLFGALAGGAGATLTTAAGAAFRRARTRVGVGAAVCILLAGFAVLVGRNVIPSTSDFYTMFEPGILNGKPSSIKFIEAKFGLWPSHPFAAELYAGATGGRAGSTASRTLLWLAPIASLALAATLGRRLYSRTLPVIVEGLVLATGGVPAAVARRRFPRRLHGAIGALIERDLVGIARSPSELGRAAFLGFLLVLYTSFVVVAPLREVSGKPEAAARLLFFDVVAAGYFLTAFGLRFVFPAMSLEGRAAWVFFSSPIRIFRVFLAKLLLYGALLTIVVVPIAMLGTLRLVRDPAVAGVAFALVVLLALTTTTLALGFGAAWPNFREPNPEFLTTSGGGLALTIVCLVYVALMGWIARGAALAAAGGGSALGSALWAAPLSVGLGVVAVAVAYRRLRALEAA
jgi:ABC-2 type transport system permease protein